MAWKGAPESPDTVAAPRDDSLPDRSADGAVADDPAFGFCPYLLVPDGGYRLARAAREHRCTAERPFDAPSTERQRRLCLDAAHLTCPTFAAARGRRESALLEAGIPVHEGALPRMRPLGRTTPVILVGGRGAPHWPGSAHETGSGGVDAEPVRGVAAGTDVARPGISRGIRRGVPGSSGRDGRSGGASWRRLAGPATAIVILLAAVAVIAAQLPGGASPSPTPAGSPAALVAGSPSTVPASPLPSAAASASPPTSPWRCCCRTM